MCVCPPTGVPVESYRELEELHQQPSTTGYFYGQCQCSGYSLPDHWLFLQDKRDQISRVDRGETHPHVYLLVNIFKLGSIAWHGPFIILKW